MFKKLSFSLAFFTPPVLAQGLVNLNTQYAEQLGLGNADPRTPDANLLPVFKIVILLCGSTVFILLIRNIIFAVQTMARKDYKGHWRYLRNSLILIPILFFLWLLLIFIESLQSDCWMIEGVYNA